MVSAIEGDNSSQQVDMGAYFIEVKGMFLSFIVIKLAYDSGCVKLFLHP